ncbi:MAG: FKBP-type peptidyl-prolyl cis-trans isomerase [Candidatus Neomarinimicrobiota bacterium]|nr:MAG: FKBP-type peptidyl-prolyl cis-trans isomerase [Candidatus Neomarinimicrobiota bacterium]
MKRLVLLGAAMALIAGCSQPQQTTTVTELKTHQDSVSYSIGMDIGSSFTQRQIDVEPEVFFQGFKDGTQGNTLLTQEQMQQVSLAFQKELREKQLAQQKEEAATHRKEGAAFQEKYAQEDGVVKLENGILYKVLKSGDGATPKAGDRVKVHYTGKLIDGTVFDSSVERGEPATFGVTQVIKGWTYILQRMKVGDKWEVVIPSDLGYGDRGAGGRIPPGATLIFEIELIDIV